MKAFSTLSVLIFLVISMHLGNASQRQCPGNELKGRHMCNCHEGNAIESLTTSFDRYTKDRVWNISCTTSNQYMAKSSSCEDLTTKWTSFKADFDHTFKSHSYTCLFKHGVLTGWESEFDSGANDRRYRFTYSVPHMWGVVVDSCRTRKVSSFETHGHFTVPEGQVIRGIQSVYNGKYSDREWSLSVCKISRECDIIKDIKFSEVKDPTKVLSYGEITRESQVTDATGHNSDIEAELTLSHETTKSLTETQRFESTSASTISNTASVSVSASIEVPFVTMQVEGGYEFKSEKMTSKTWSRETTTEYSETNGKEMEWQYTCQAGTKCEAVVSIFQASVKIPYTMRVGSSNSMEMCRESGIYERVQTFTKFQVTTIATTTIKPTTLKTTATTTTTTAKSTSAVSTTQATTKSTPSTAKATTRTTTISTSMKMTTPKPSLNTHQTPLPLKSGRSVSTLKPANAKTTSEPVLATETFLNVTYELTLNDSLPLGTENANVSYSDVADNGTEMNIVDKTDDTQSGIVPKGDDEQTLDDDHNLLEKQQHNPLTDGKNTNSQGKKSMNKENLTTKEEMNTGTLHSENHGSVIKENAESASTGTHKIDCKEDISLPSLCQTISGCVNGVPAAAKITAYMVAMAMSVALAMKLSTALMT